LSFLIVPDRKALVLNVQDPAKVLAAVPTARPFPYRGHNLVAAPHGIVETQTLRAMGMKLPSPIGWQYDWPRDRTLIPEPFPEQKETAGFATLFKRAYILNEIGTGKTLSTLWALDFLMHMGMLNSVIITGPLSSLERAWGDEIFYHLRHRKFAVLHGTARRRHRLLAEKKDFYIVNHDGFEIIEEALRLRPDIDAMVLDELGDYANPTNKQRAVRAFVNDPKRRIEWVWGLTGTPVPDDPSQAWGQCRIVTPWTVPQYYGTFRNMTMNKVSEYKWVARPEAQQIVNDAMQPAIRFERKNLPGETISQLEAPMTPTQAKHYKELKNDAVTMIGEAKITAVNEGVLRMRLMQAAAGVVYDKQGNHIRLDCGPRVQQVKELIHHAGTKVIVYATFTGLVHMLLEELSKHWSCEMVYGQTSKANRDRIFASFQREDAPRVLVADPGCMSHALTLTKAATIAWYNPPDTNKEFTQANGRITRPGQTQMAHIACFYSTPLERAVYNRLKARQTLQGLVLDIVKAGMEL